MGSAAVEDLVSLDRDVRRAAAALAAWRASRAGEPHGPAAPAPFDGLRHVAGKSTYDALAGLSPSTAEAPLRDGLARWVAYFVQTRIGLAQESAWAESAATPLGRFTGESPRRVGWREAWRGAAHARTPAEARLWVHAAADVG